MITSESFIAVSFEAGSEEINPPIRIRTEYPHDKYVVPIVDPGGLMSEISKA
jgi:hypothetical protein